MNIFVVPIVLVLSVNNCLGRVLSDSAPYTYYTREDWGAIKSNDTRPLSTPAPYVIIHHTAIPGACYDSETCKGYMRSMQRYHIGLDWGDIGYHFCVGSEGGVYEGRGWHLYGIHAGKANSRSVGICLIGDWRTELPPKVQLDAAKALIAEGVKNGALASDYNLIGHMQVMMTECPGLALLGEISKWPHYVPGHVNFKR